MSNDSDRVAGMWRHLLSVSGEASSWRVDEKNDIRKYNISGT